MDELIAAAFDGEDDARAAFLEAEKHWDHADPGLHGIALVVTASDGTASITSPQSEASDGDAVVGPVVFGAFVGAIFTVPVVGLALGGVTAAIFALTRNRSVRNDVRTRITTLIAPGRSGVVVFASQARANGMAGLLAGLGGEIARNPLSDDEAKALRELVGS